ncbi:MAG: hypothetical protein WA192_09430 [Candidatus Acidiferrales bacterium]
MRGQTITRVAGFFLAALLSAPAWGAAQIQPNTTAIPGTINYVEGQVSIGARVLNSNSIGSAALEPNQSLATANGNAEVLLTPGIFVRLRRPGTSLAASMAVVAAASVAVVVGTGGKGAI